MERYLVFAGSHYYPSGGFNDYQGSYATLEEAKNFLRINLNPPSGSDWSTSPRFDWGHIVDMGSESGGGIVCEAQAMAPSGVRL